MSTTQTQSGAGPLSIVAGGTLTSGTPALIGELFCVPIKDAVSGDVVGVAPDGVHTLPAATSQAWTLGQALYWDAGAGELTTTPTVRRVGVAAAVKDSAAAVGSVRLDGTAVSGMSLSAEATGTGSAQNVAHGLGVVPRIAVAIPSNLTGGAYVVTYGTHTTTNVVLTVTSGEKFQVLAIR